MFFFTYNPGSRSGFQGFSDIDQGDGNGFESVWIGTYGHFIIRFNHTVPVPFVNFSYPYHSMGIKFRGSEGSHTGASYNLYSGVKGGHNLPVPDCGPVKKDPVYDPYDIISLLHEFFKLEPAYRRLVICPQDFFCVLVADAVAGKDYCSCPHLLFHGLSFLSLEKSLFFPELILFPVRSRSIVKSSKPGIIILTTGTATSSLERSTTSTLSASFLSFSSITSIFSAGLFLDRSCTSERDTFSPSSNQKPLRRFIRSYPTLLIKPSLSVSSLAPWIWTTRDWAASVMALATAISGFRWEPAPITRRAGSFSFTSSVAAITVGIPVSVGTSQTFSSISASLNFLASS